MKHGLRLLAFIIVVLLLWKFKWWIVTIGGIVVGAYLLRQTKGGN